MARDVALFRLSRVRKHTAVTKRGTAACGVLKKDVWLSSLDGEQSDVVASIAR